MDEEMDKLLMFFESSSNNSGSETEDGNFDDNLIGQIISEALEYKQKNDFFYENIIPNYTDKEFLVHFKVPRNLLCTLSVEYEQSIYYSHTKTGFAPVPSEKCMFCFVWYATHEAASCEDVADRFDIAPSTLHLIVHNVSLFLSFKSDVVIKWPNNEMQLKISEDFEVMGFPGVVGCIDGIHIKIDKPEEDPDPYLNRKKYYSLQVQLVCDSRRQIIDVVIGYPGSVHDARVFKNSSLHQTLHTKCGDKYLLGDSAYPCLRNLLTPYRDTGHLNESEKNFSKKLSRCRVLVEHTNGILRQRFRQLYHSKLRDIEDICNFLRACCVLHNLIMQYNQANDQEVDLENDVEVVDPNFEAKEIDMDDDEFEGNQAGHNFRNLQLF